MQRYRILGSSLIWRSTRFLFLRGLRERDRDVKLSLNDLLIKAMRHGFEGSTRDQQPVDWNGNPAIYVPPIFPWSRRLRARFIDAYRSWR